ncbi:surfeit locus protein 1-like [Ylistrum balloti]|uniref:surfeit locus protein 1-like n=1 Tax=Ylistrum balloti TaxID=509963 RepID=UPI00290594E3|nr:surfeit locus protein 1-like [Ylistrum balloti]
MSKQKFLLRHLWRSLKLRSKPEHIRSYRKDASKQKSPVSTLKSIFTEVAWLTVPAVTFSLGTWQVSRKEWKEKKIAYMQNKVSSPPIPLPENLEDLKDTDMEYTPLRVVGEFDHEMERYIYPRANVQDIKISEVKGMGVTPTRGGMLVITPFKLKDRDERILINRGWIQKTNVDPNSRSEGQVKGEVELVGVLRHSEASNTFTQNQGLDNPKVLIKRDVDSLAETLKTSPVYLDADFSSTVEGGPIGGQTIVTLRNEHLQYILTWYALCIVSLVFYARRFRKPPALQTQIRRKK